MDDLAAVLFDLDGTLCLAEQSFPELLAGAFDDAGVAPIFDQADVDAVDRGTLPDAETTREFFTHLFGAAAERAGTAPDDAALAAVVDAYLDRYEPARVRTRPGARAALSAARDCARVGLVTNGGRETQAAKLETVGLADAFETAVYCDPAAGIDPKPDPTPVRLAVEELGVAPGRTLLVGDSLHADVAGAHNAGARSAWVPRPADAVVDPEPAPDHVLAGMDELAALLGG